MSHDLRAPLRAIDAFSQALLEDYDPTLDAQGKDYLRRIRTNTGRLAQLIDDLLQLSRLPRTELYFDAAPDRGANFFFTLGEHGELATERDRSAAA